MTRLHASLTAVLLVAGIAGHAGTALAAGYPDRAITLVNPYAPGGPADTLARTLAKSLSERLGQPVIVENRPGAGATVGTSYVSRARPDGYTLVLATSPGNVVGPLMQKLSYDGVKDFDFIAMVADQPVMVVTNAGTGIDSLKGLIERAKAKPGSLNFASAGTGGATHLSGELLQQRAGIQLTHVPYKGAAPALQDLIGGQVELAMLSLAAALPQIQDGKLKAIAYSGDQRSPLLPEVPTVVESGIPDFRFSTWYVLAAPKGLPDDIKARLNRDVNAINATPDQQAFLKAQDATAKPMTPAELDAFVAEDHTAMSQLLGSLKLLAQP